MLNPVYGDEIMNNFSNFKSFILIKIDARFKIRKMEF